MTGTGADGRRRAWPIATSAQAAAWDAWAALLLEARHPSLGRVLEVTRDDVEGVVVVAVPDGGGEDVLAWAARSGASVPDRLLVLAAVAAALDALHGGPDGGHGLPHGAVGPDTVRVDAAGAVRVVGFAPWTGWTGDDPGIARFRAPELAPGAAATVAGDRWAFARLVAEVLGGERATAAADVPALVRALRVSADTRRRTRLVRAVESLLTSPPEARTQPLTAWLAAAVEGTAATGTVPPVADDVAEPAPLAPVRRRRTALVTALALVVLVAVGGAALGSRWRSDRDPAAPEPEVEVVHAEPFSVVATWADQCGAGTGIAAEDALPGYLQDRTTAAQVADDAKDARGGRWHHARLLLTLRAWQGSEPVTVVGIEQARPVSTDPPSWRVTRTAGCSDGPEPDRVAELDLDTLVLRPAEFEPISLATRAVVVALDVTACRGNYRWMPELQYLTASGDTGTVDVANDVLAVFGRMAGTRTYTIGAGRERPRWVDAEDGPDPAC